MPKTYEEPAGRGMEPAGRGMEPAGRVRSYVGGARSQLGRGSEPAGRPSVPDQRLERKKEKTELFPIRASVIVHSGAAAQNKFSLRFMDVWQNELSY